MVPVLSVPSLSVSAVSALPIVTSPVVPLAVSALKVQVELGEGAAFNGVVRNRGSLAVRCDSIQSDRAAGGQTSLGIIGLNDGVSRRTRKDQFAAI